MEDNLRMTRNHRSAGYILLLMLLAVILLGMIFSYKAWRGHGVKVDSGEELKNPPWQQWRNIQKHLARGDLGKPASQQPQITETWNWMHSFSKIRMKEGQLSLRFNPDYTIEGELGWHFLHRPQ